MNFRLLIFCLVIVLALAERSSGVVINEIHLNGVDNTVRNEFVELYNPAVVAVNLAGWRVTGGVDFTFPAGTSIAAGGYLVVAASPATILATFSKTALGPWTGALNSEGETVRLRNSTDAVIDEVDYQVGFPWPVAAGGEGASLEKIHPSLSGSLGASWRSATIPADNATTDIASPGAVNLRFSTNAPPAIRQVQHLPQQPLSTNPIVITAMVTDPQGVASVVLSYQVVAPGNYIPRYLSNVPSGNDIATETRVLNPDYELAANWTSVTMVDSGTGGDVLAGDGIYTAVVAAKPHRTLLRYRITVTDTPGNSVRVPYADDPAANFACFIYNGVPAYAGTTSATLQTVPVYHLITKESDWADCIAYESDKKIAQGRLARFYYNWNGTFVYDGVVYDHISYRTRGANGRYQAEGKRSMRFKFHRGSYITVRDQKGNPYPKKWQTLTTGKGFENRQTLTYGLNEWVNYRIWNANGVPAPGSHFAHWRNVTTAAEQADAFHGDFQGLRFILEDYDVRFLEAHAMQKGNLYKLLNQTNVALDQQRYQAPDAVKDGSDHNWIESDLTGATPAAEVTATVNLDAWSRYHAVCQAVRHYDYWPSANKNMAFYFEPVYTPQNGNRGKLWILPFDTDASWGPSWNSGDDVVYSAVFGTAGGPGSSTLWPTYFNAVREIRDLLFQPDQINALIDEGAAVLAPLIPADDARWKTAPADVGSYTGIGGAGAVSLANLVQDMKNFAFTGGSWPGGNVDAGGRAAFLDSLGDSQGEGANIPVTPSLSYIGTAGHPVSNLRFQTGAFSDPQGAGTFGSMQWRVAEVTNPLAPGYVAGEAFKLELAASYLSPAITSFAGQFRFPAAACRPGHTYRARVRTMDNTGRVSHWSAPVQFTATAVNLAPYQQSLVITEIMYHPPAPSPAEALQGWSDGDFEFIELRNVGGTSIDLTDVRFTKGINFDFPSGLILQPGANTVVVRNLAAFTARYGTGLPVAGVWEAGNALSDGGEEVKLSFGAGDLITAVTYDNSLPWPAPADGGGSSLIRFLPQNFSLDPNQPTSWRASAVPGGSPGAFDPTGGTEGILINEVLTNSALPLVDSIELYNSTNAPVDVSDWWLSDSGSNPKKYRIPVGTVIPPGGYVTFTEAQFNPTPGVGNSFSLNSNGEEVYLYSGDASGNLTGYALGFSYQAADENVGFGRHVNSVGEESFPVQSARTPGAANAGPQIGPLVINEIQYFPAVGLDEYVEIRNVSASAVNLWDPANPTNTWKLTGLDFVFPANTTIPAGGYALIVGLSPSAFRTKYAIPASVQIFATAGILNNSGQRLTLEKPAPPYVNGAQTVVPFVIVDSVRYSSVAPWQSGAAGGGSSLQRSSGSSFADDPANWGTGGLTPGAPNVINQVPSIALTNPPPGASYILPSVLEFSTTASDPDGVVTKVEFFSGSTLIGTDTTAPFSFAWTSFTTGSHTITARATDNSFGTTTSAPVTIQVTGAGTGGAGTGWYAQYYKDSNGTTHLVDPPLGTRTDATLNFNSTAGWPNNFVPGVAPTGTLFSGRWSGRLLAPATGTFNFYTGSADGIRLFINGQLLINHWTDHAYTTHAAALALTAGQFYDIVVEYYQNLGDAVLRLDYECTAAGIARQVIPAARVYPAGAPLLLARPGPVTLSTGQTIGFNVLATGGGALTYQWQRNNVNIAGATSTSLLLQDPLATQAGTYRVIVTNAMGSTTSGSAGLAIPDTDGDSIPDYWETQNGLNPAVANPGDTDGDGASDVAEYLAGTHPQNAASHLTLSVIQGTVPVTNYRLSFTGQSNRSYSLQYKNTLSAPTWSPLHQIPAANGLRALKFIDPAAGQAERYYRVITPLE